jgi:hypothetical protein
VDLVSDQLLRTSEKFRGDNDNRGGTITNLLVLQVSELDEDLGCRVLYLEQLEDGGTIVCDCHILGAHMKMRSKRVSHRRRSEDGKRMASRVG